MQICDGCGWLEIERPVNRYDVWRACCCDPDKPLPGKNRVVGVAPYSAAEGPAGIQRPLWCRIREISACYGPGKKEAATVAETP